MEYLSVEEVLVIHHYMIERFGGTHGIINISLLESAIYRPKTSYSGEEKYITVCEKASVLLHSLIKNHSFVDGNKRTAIVSTLLFLEKNNCDIKVTNSELVGLAIKIEKDQVNISEIAEILENYS